jgi:hypothetical protein
MSNTCKGVAIGGELDPSGWSCAKAHFRRAQGATALTGVASWMKLEPMVRVPGVSSDTKYSTGLSMLLLLRCEFYSGCSHYMAATPQANLGDEEDEGFITTWLRKRRHDTAMCVNLSTTPALYLMSPPYYLQHPSSYRMGGASLTSANACARESLA